MSVCICSSQHPKLIPFWKHPAHSADDEIRTLASICIHHSVVARNFPKTTAKRKSSCEKYAWPVWCVWVCVCVLREGTHFPYMCTMWLITFPPNTKIAMCVFVCQLGLAFARHCRRRRRRRAIRIIIPRNWIPLEDDGWNNGSLAGKGRRRVIEYLHKFGFSGDWWLCTVRSHAVHNKIRERERVRCIISINIYKYIYKRGGFCVADGWGKCGIEEAGKCVKPKSILCLSICSTLACFPFPPNWIWIWNVQFTVVFV